MAIYDDDDDMAAFFKTKMNSAEYESQSKEAYRQILFVADPKI